MGGRGGRVAPHLEVLVCNELCWPRAGALLAHLGAVPPAVVRAACAAVSEDATASIALLDALKARGAVDDAAASVRVRSIRRVHCSTVSTAVGGCRNFCARLEKPSDQDHVEFIRWKCSCGMISFSRCHAFEREYVISIK